MPTKEQQRLYNSAKQAAKDHGFDAAEIYKMMVEWYEQERKTDALEPKTRQ